MTALSNTEKNSTIPTDFDRLKSISKPRQTFQDIHTFTIHESDFTNYETGTQLETQKRDVPCSDGLQWWITYLPTSTEKKYKSNVGLFLCVNKPVSAKYIFTIEGINVEKVMAYNFLEASSYGNPAIASHKKLRPLFVDGRLSITCQVEFDISLPSAVMAPRIGQCCEHVPTNVELVVGSERLKAHKSLLSLVSPVFHVMLTDDTAESETGEIEITDFGYGTVKSAIDFCYGRKMANTSVESTINTLRFADKYIINADELEQVAFLNLDPESFPAALKYANAYFKDVLFNRCCDYFKRNASDVIATDSFARLSPELIARLLKRSFNLKTDCDILRSARKNGVVMEPLEQRIIKNLSLDIFCDTCKYVWDYSRDNLKKDCGRFFNANKVEILALNSFVALGPKIVYGVIKSGHEIL